GDGDDGGGNVDGPGPRVFTRTAERSTDVIVTPGTNLQAVIDSSPAGSVIRFRPGTYRLAQMAPKADMKMIADPGVVLKGSKVLGGDETWISDGSRWYVGGQTQGSTAPVQGEEWGFCDDDRPACVFPEDLFVGGEPLRRESSLGAVGPGEWFFDYAADRIYIGDNPVGRTVEVSVSSWAFHGSADRIRIEGFAIEQYATPGRQGAINPRVGRIGSNGVDWVVVGNTIRHGHGWGIKIEHGMVVADNVTDENGQGGIGGVGDNVLIEHNEITGNCIAGYRCFGWEGGGTKFVTEGMVFSDNVVSDNLGHGMHPDILSDDVLIEGNLVEDNTGVGIHYETSTNAVIRDNVVNRNGFKPDGSREPGILVLNSVGVDITGNILDGNALGILLRQDDRTDRGIVGDVSVTGNRVTGGTNSRSGVGSVTIDAGLLGVITFQSNTYSYIDERPFTFAGTTYTPTGWQGLGFDTSSSFTRR
ncbi:MAG: right-handed parallel beta-helix repeat-containing protein, partial [Acidimicrobiia bacterium]